MYDIAISIGGYLCDAAAAARVPGIRHCYSHSYMSTLGWLVIIGAALVPAGWLAFRTR